MNDTELFDELRRVAVALDAAAPVTDTGAVKGRHPASAPTRRGAVVLAAAAVVLVVLGAGVAMVVADRDQDVRIETPATGPATTAATSTTDAAPTTEGPPATPTTEAPVAPVPLTSYEGHPWDQLPPAGFAYVTKGGDGVLLADAFGRILEGSFTAAEVPGLGNDPADGIAIGPGPEAALAPVAPVGDDGCPTTAGGGVRIATCGEPAGRIERVEPSGERTELAGLPFGSTAGGYRWAQASPDGEWVLAAYSGECEVPMAVFVPAAGGELRSADGFTDWGGDEGPGPVESVAVGWAPDGRAVVQFREGVCGSGDDAPGTYLVDPATGERELLRAELDDRVLQWTKVEPGNERERLLARVRAELGLEGCCGEPAHGGLGVNSGVVWDGTEVPISGGEPGPVAVTDLDAVRGVDLRGGSAIEGVYDGIPLLAFTCGDTTWKLGGAPVFEGEPPRPALLLAVAEALVPRLACTLAPRPEGEAGG